ncbi:DUF6760 family protein [Streptomyces sp. WZ-12]|uniref:DUF6760 family protein n=1 Tax=Streptomyces sp. WZ-12 TaxID=3030210 RepID=UPI0023815611|nr:DUF6760 family protein [Streptomyces sp. WZ-12]
MTHPVDQLHRETSYIAYHFHWALQDIHSLTHHERLRYVNEINRINTTINEGR